MISSIIFAYFIAIYGCLAVPLEEILAPVVASNCMPGYYCVANDRARSVTPQACPPGTFTGIGAPVCTPCSLGYWTVRYASSYCDVCPIGHMCYNASFFPEPCPLGTANPFLGQPNCFACNTGDYTPGLQSPACATCPHGHFCTDAAEQPKPCPPGK